MSELRGVGAENNIIEMYFSICTFLWQRSHFEPVLQNNFWLKCKYHVGCSRIWRSQIKKTGARGHAYDFSVLSSTRLWKAAF